MAINISWITKKNKQLINIFQNNRFSIFPQNMITLKNISFYNIQKVLSQKYTRVKNMKFLHSCKLVEYLIHLIQGASFIFTKITEINL